MTDKQYANGMFFYLPSEKAQSFIKMNINVNREQTIEWLAGMEDDIFWVQVNEKKNNPGSGYGEVDTYRKEDVDNHVDGLKFVDTDGSKPDFVKLHVSINRDQFAEWLDSQDDEWVRFQVKNDDDLTWEINTYKKTDS